MPGETSTRLDGSSSGAQRLRLATGGRTGRRSGRRLTPQLELAPAGGHLVVTHFHCQHRAALIVLHLLHRRVKREVRRKVAGCLGVTTLTDWRRGELRSISLWRKAEDIYQMGEVSSHVLAARVPGRLQVSTRSGVFSYVGDWRRVLFGSSYTDGSPLTGWRPEDNGGT